MSFRRRRTRSGLPVAVIIAIITAIFGGRMAQRAKPATAPAASTERRAPVTPTPAGAANAPTGATPVSRNAPGFSTRQHLVEHFEKHGAEFPGLDMAAYLRAAQSLRDQPAGGPILELKRRDGVLTRFDKGSGAFLAANRDGTIRTFFRPNDGEAYFRRQASRRPGGGP
jgi:pyocin large subunit-like protein